MSAPLDLQDPSVDRLCDEERLAIAGHWRRRVRSELSVSVSFGLLERGLADARAEPIVIQLAKGAREQEVRHAEICRRLAERYAGVAVEPTELPVVELPRYETGDEAFETSLHAVGLCCVNETIAGVWLDATLSAATAPLARNAIRQHLSEEIDHGRLGWAHLASSRLAPRDRERIADHLVDILDTNVRRWLLPDLSVPLGHRAHGMLSASDSRAVVLAAVRDVVLPGFRRVGVETADAVRWFAALEAELVGPVGLEVERR